MKLNTKIITAGIAAFSLVTAGVVCAHPGMGQGSGMGPGAGMGMGMGMGMHAGAQGPETAAGVAARLEGLKAELKITAAQEGAWQGFVSAVQQQVVARDAMRAQMQTQMHGQAGGQGQGPNAAPADRSAHFESMAKFREQHLAARSAALKDLYAVLTPEQKLVAEQRLDTMPGHRMAGRVPAK